MTAQNDSAQPADSILLSPLTLASGVAHVVRLGPSWAAAAARLHAATLRAMGADESAFMLHKSRDDFAAHMRRGAGNGVIAIVQNGTLIAQSLIHHPTRAHPDNGMTALPAPPPPARSSVMQAVSVNPAYRGQKLMDVMIAHWLTHAAHHKRDHVMAEIHVDNVASWLGFLRAGLHLTGLVTDPADGSPLYNAQGLLRHGHITPAFNAAAAPQSCALRDFKTQSALMARGYRITACDPRAGVLTLRPA